MNVTLQVERVIPGGKKRYTVSQTANDGTDLVEVVGPLIAEIADRIRNDNREGIPLWQDFDVITVLMGKDRKPYTYMRKDGIWPGEHSWTEMDDEKVDKLWGYGRVTLVIREGQPLSPVWTKGTSIAAHVEPRQ